MGPESHPWLLGSGVNSDERVARGAVALLNGEEQRLKGAMRLPAEFRPRQGLIARSTEERDRAKKIIASAGVRLVQSRDRKVIARLEIDSTQVSVPLKLDVTELMSALLTESPTWYNVSSGVTHSLCRGFATPWLLSPASPWH